VLSSGHHLPEPVYGSLWIGWLSQMSKAGDGFVGGGRPGLGSVFPLPDLSVALHQSPVRRNEHLSKRSQHTGLVWTLGRRHSVSGSILNLLTWYRVVLDGIRRAVEGSADISEVYWYWPLLVRVDGAAQCEFIPGGKGNWHSSTIPGKGRRQTDCQDLHTVTQRTYIGRWFARSIR